MTLVDRLSCLVADYLWKYRPKDEWEKYVKITDQLKIFEKDKKDLLELCMQKISEKKVNTEKFEDSEDKVKISIMNQGLQKAIDVLQEIKDLEK